MFDLMGMSTSIYCMQVAQMCQVPWSCRSACLDRQDPQGSG